MKTFAEFAALQEGSRPEGKHYKNYEHDSKYSSYCDADWAYLSRVAKDTAEKLAKKYKKYASSKTSSTRAAPNTASFRATVSNMIEYRPYEDYTDGMFRRRGHHFLKIGGGVDYKIRKKIVDEYIKEVKMRAGIDGKHDMFMTEDPYRCSFGQVSGTNWGGVGIVVHATYGK